MKPENNPEDCFLEGSCPNRHPVPSVDIFRNFLDGLSAVGLRLLTGTSNEKIPTLNQA